MNLAPNGKPSNLTPEQYKLVRTPEFKAWFGDWENNPEGASKVVDENGEPLVVYHGSDTVYSENIFKKFYNRDSYTKGKYKDYWFFSQDIYEAKRYGNEVKPFFIKSIKIFNPVIYNALPDLSENEKKQVYDILSENKDYFLSLYSNDTLNSLDEVYEGGIYEDNSEFGSGWVIENIDKNDILWFLLTEDNDNYIIIESNKFQDFLKQNRYDSFTTSESGGGILNIATYNNRNIKLADGTNTTFDSENPDIRFDGGGLIAPNGNPSNLTPEQYKLVRTPEFKAWFGDWENNPEGASKVVDENGEPMVVLHGSTGFHDGKNSDIEGEITQFSSERLIFTTTNTDVAKYFGDYKYYFINIKNPFVIDDKYYSWDRLDEDYLIKKLGEKTFIEIVNYEYLENFTFDEWIDYVNEVEALPISIDTIGYYVKKYFNNYDGIIAYNIEETTRNIVSDDYIAFEPTQIKLADGTNTTFDSENPDIRFDGGGLIAPNGNPSNLTPEQYKLVRTPEFKAWFGDWENNPKEYDLIDGNGEPMVWYHTGGNWNELKNGGIDGTGKLMFSPTKKSMAYGSDAKNNTQITRPFFIKSDFIYMLPYEHRDSPRKYQWHKSKKNPVWFVDAYGGFIVVRQSNQIKLADGTNITFDANNPDIRFDGGGLVFSVTGAYGDKRATNESIAKYIAKKVGSDLELYHKSRSGSEYYLLKNIKNQYKDGNFLQLRVSDHEILSRNPFLANHGGADISWEKPIYNNKWDIEELDEWIDEFILENIEDGNYVRQESNGNGSNTTFDVNNPDIRFDGGGNVPDYFWGNQAGGVLIICSRTNKVLLLKRSPYVQEPETWGMISGKIDAGETVEEAVAREVKEETGWKIDNLIPSYVFKKNDFTFYNFISVVDIEFTPTLDWENTDYGWFDLDNLPENLHFGLEILLLKENLNDLQVLDNKKAEYFKEGGYVKSQKVYVSIKLPYTFEKENEKDIMKSFIRYEDKPFQELQEHKLVGVIGVSKSRENIADWLIFRDCLIVMNYDEFMQLNDATEIEYDNPEQLMANDLELFNRLYGNKREQNEDEFNTKSHRRNNLSKILNSFPFEFKIAGKVEKDNQLKNELYRIEYFTNQSETGKFMNWLETNQYIINSPQEFADLIIKYHYSDESKSEISSFYGNTDNLKITSEYIYPIVYKALIKAGSTYTDEEEIILNNRVLNIPDDSQLFFVEKEKSNQLELIDKYNLKDTYRVSFVKQENIDRFRGQIDKKRSESFTQKRESNIQGLQEKSKEVLPVLLQEIKQHISDYFYSKAKKSFDKDNYYKEYEGDDTKYYSVEEIPEVQQLLNGALDIIDDVFKETFYSSDVNDIDKYRFSNFTYVSNDKLREYINSVQDTLSDEIFKYHNEYNDTVYANELTWTLRELFDYGESPIKELDKVALAQRYIELMEGEMFRYIPERLLNLFKKGGRTIAQTPAPKKEQIKGSDKNKEGSSKDIKSAKSIELSEKTIKSIKNKVDEHNEKYPKKKINLASAKAVVRRGMGAYSSSHRPTISGGKPNSRVAWGLARLNAFIYKIVNGKSKSGKYNQDDDLIKELGYKVKNYKTGGMMEKSELQKGIETEMEHSDTIKKIMTGKYSIEESAELIAKDHLKENDKYYTHLAEMERKFDGGGQTPEQKGLINRISKRYNIILDYKIGQSFKVDVMGGTTTAYIKSFDFSVNRVDGKPKMNRDSYRIHYSVNGREESSHYSYLKNLKQEKNEITLEVPYSLDGGIFFENSRYDGNLKLLNGKVNGFKINYYGDRSFNNKWFTYYADINGKSYNIDSKDAYSSLDNYVSRVSENTYFKKDLQKFTPPKGGKIQTKLDYQVGQKFKVAKMGGYEEAEIVGIKINVGAESGEVFKKSSDSKIKINSESWERPYEYYYEEFEENIREKRFIINKKVNEIETDVKVLFSEKYLIITRYMEGSKLRVQDLSSYVLEINNSSIKVGYRDRNGDTIFDIFTSIDDFKKQIISNDNFKKGGQTLAQQEKIAKVMGEFKRGELNTSYGTKVTDDKQAIAIALSEAGVEKKEEGGVIEGQLHSECNDDSGCGEKFDVGGVGNVIEAERDEAVIVSSAFSDTNRYKIKGTPSQIASALNVMGGGKNFDGGAIIDFNGKIIDTNKIRKETNDTDVKDDIESGSVIINRRSMYDNTIYEVEGTPKQIASAINSVNGYGVVIENGATIKEA